jgi:hypothetical protein
MSQKKLRFHAHLTASAWTAITRAEWNQLCTALPDISESSLREWLQETGIPIDQPYRGVQTKSFEELENSLLAMAQAYAGDRETAKACRALVIAAKDRTRFASKNPKVAQPKRAEKEEMVRWMLVWLDDPAMFAPWVALRKAQSTIT